MENPTTTTRRTYKARPCNECGAEYQPRRTDQFFCSTPCRKDFENRMMTRGRDLYSLFMTMRYERGLAKALGVWAIMCRVAMEFRAQDERERQGRKSWIPAKRVIATLPLVAQLTDITVIHNAAGNRRR